MSRRRAPWQPTHMRCDLWSGGSADRKSARLDCARTRPTAWRAQPAHRSLGRPWLYALAWAAAFAALLVIYR